MKTNKFRRRNTILFLATVLSIILYFVGVLSGIFANKVFKDETKKDISNLKSETKQDFQYMQNYVIFLDTNLKNMQLEQTFTETLNHEQMCDFLAISMDELVNQLGFYWNKLPFRIEKYEKENKVTDEYLLLKEQYLHLSIRTWLIAKNEYEKCNINIVHGLYFYSQNCDVCVKQGEQIDILNKKIKALDTNLIMFPVDFDSNQTIIKALKKYYNIKSTPAIIINDKVFQGRLFSSTELMEFPRNATR